MRSGERTLHAAWRLSYTIVHALGRDGCSLNESLASSTRVDAKTARVIKSVKYTAFRRERQAPDRCRIDAGYRQAR